MRWAATAAFVAAFLVLIPGASASEDCFELFADPALAPVEPGEPAVLFTARGARTLNEFVVKLFDAQGSELPIAVEVDPSHGSFFLRSATRIEPGDYVVEYTHECNGTTRMQLAFEASPPKPPEPPEPGDEKKGCDCRAVSHASSSASGAIWLAAAAVLVAVRRRSSRVA
jgi:MYXO-CTERM domain-containing protein